jgi:8-oxo-dGTP pyrophosphatase MutT (NUDIX family)
MDKFSKIKNKKKVKKESPLLFDANSFKVVKKSGWNFIEEPDSVCVIPIIIEKNEIMLRMEVIPPYQNRDGEDFHLTCISGTVEEGEDLKECLKRELEEEAGMVLKDSVVIEFFDNLYKSKTGSSKFHLSILPINIYNYDEVLAKGDGSKTEEMSKTVRVNIKNIKNLFPSDVVTKLLLEEVKKYMNIK